MRFIIFWQPGKEWSWQVRSEPNTILMSSEAGFASFTEAYRAAEQFANAIRFAPIVDEDGNPVQG